MMRQSSRTLRAILSMGTLLVLSVGSLASAPLALESLGDRTIRAAGEAAVAVARTPVRFEGVDRRPSASPNPHAIQQAAPLAGASDAWTGSANRRCSPDFVEQAVPRPRRLTLAYDATAPPVDL
jgi:hypothetical protein